MEFLVSTLDNWREWLNFAGIAANLGGFIVLWREYSVAIAGAERREEKTISNNDRAFPSPQRLAYEHQFKERYGRYAGPGPMMSELQRAAHLQERERQAKLDARTTLAEVASRKGIFQTAAFLIIAGACFQLASAAPTSTLSYFHSIILINQCQVTGPIAEMLPYFRLPGALLLLIGLLEWRRVPSLSQPIAELKREGLGLANLIKISSDGSWRSTPGEMHLTNIEDAKVRLRKIQQKHDDLTGQRNAKVVIPLFGVTFLLLGILPFCSN